METLSKEQEKLCQVLLCALTFISDGKYLWYTKQEVKVNKEENMKRLKKCCNLIELNFFFKTTARRRIKKEVFIRSMLNDHGDVFQSLSSRADTSISENLILCYLVVLLFHTSFFFFSVIGSFSIFKGLAINGKPDYQLIFSWISPVTSSGYGIWVSSGFSTGILRVQ